ncbi:MAG: hypothetical protein ACRCX2_07295 [Paraclostridium sp.]
MSYSEFKESVESVINRLERRVLKKDLSEKEAFFMDEVVRMIKDFNNGYTPVEIKRNSVEIKNSTESKIMDMLDEIGVGYFVMMNVTSPLKLFGLMNLIEQELLLVENLTKDSFFYKNEQYDIVYYDNIGPIGRCIDDTIVINKKRASLSKNGILMTIIHELVHFVIMKSNLSFEISKLKINQFEELICETIAVNNEKYKFVKRADYAEKI